MAIIVESQDNKFRVRSEDFFTDWLPDTSANKRTLIVLLKQLKYPSGKSMFTFQELAQIVESDKRQASSQYYEEFRARGSDFLSYLQRKKKIDENVVLAVLKRVKLDPLADNKNLVQPVNEELGRNDLTEVNIKTAMDQISYGKIRGDLKSVLDTDVSVYLSARKRYGSY